MIHCKSIIEIIKQDYGAVNKLYPSAVPNRVTAAVAQWLRASIFRQICMSTFEWRGFESRWCLSVGI